MIIGCDSNTGPADAMSMVEHFAACRGRMAFKSLDNCGYVNKLGIIVIASLDYVPQSRQDFFRSITPWIPLLRDRVEEYVANHYPTPMAFKTHLVFHNNFTDGAHLPKGGLERISPDVPSHALPKGQQGLKLGGCQHAE